jgi:hypothetical protein
MVAVSELHDPTGGMGLPVLGHDLNQRPALIIGVGQLPSVALRNALSTSRVRSQRLKPWRP